MSGYNFRVRPLSWRQIAGIADDFRARLDLVDQPRFPIMEVLELVMDRHLRGFRLEVGSAREMDGAEGHTDPNGEFIELREDVYEAAWNGNGRARFTAAHELGHWNLHTNTPLARARPTDDDPAYRLSEPQANQFAAEILMPPRFFKSTDLPRQVMRRHGVSNEAAINRLSYFRKNKMLEF